MNSAEPERRRRPSYWYESWRMYFSTNHGRAYAFGCVSLRLCGWALKYVLRRLQFRRPDSPKGFMIDGMRYALLPLFLVAPRK